MAYTVIVEVSDDTCDHRPTPHQQQPNTPHMIQRPRFAHKCDQSDHPSWQLASLHLCCATGAAMERQSAAWRSQQVLDLEALGGSHEQRAARA